MRCNTITLRFAVVLVISAIGCSAEVSHKPPRMPVKTSSTASNDAAESPAPSESLRSSAYPADQPSATEPDSKAAPERNAEPNPKPDPAPASHSWPLHEVAEEGFSIRVPPEWQLITQSPQEFESMVESVEAKNPQMAAILKSARSQLGANVKFNAIEPASAATGFATNVNVIVERLPQPLTRAQFLEGTLEQIRKLPQAKPVAHKPVTTEAGEADMLTWGVTLRLRNGQTVSTSITQYLFLRDQTGTVVTFTTTDDRASTESATSEEIGKSFRFMK